MIYIAENKILEILEKPQLTKGIEKYTFLQNNLYCVDVANNEEYKNNYKISTEWLEEEKLFVINTFLS